MGDESNSHSRSHRDVKPLSAQCISSSSPFSLLASPYSLSRSHTPAYPCISILFSISPHVIFEVCHYPSHSELPQSISFLACSFSVVISFRVLLWSHDVLFNQPWEQLVRWLHAEIQTLHDHSERLEQEGRECTLKYREEKWTPECIFPVMSLA